MRTYGHYCAMARALDVVGDRWTMHIVRELWLRPRRFGELAEALPTVASNLLTERLRLLETKGVVFRSQGPRPLYSLTQRGLALGPVMDELIRWGEEEMATGPGNDLARNEWFAQAMQVLVPPEAVTGGLVFGIDTDGAGGPAVLVAEPGQGIRVARDEGTEDLDVKVRVSGDPRALVEVLAGRAAPASLPMTGTPDGCRKLRAILARGRKIRASARGA